MRRGAAKVRWVSETIDLRGRDFLAEKDFSAAELTYLMNLAEHLKRERHAGHEEQRLNGRGIALIFEKTSTRTRVSFEAAIAQQGGFSSVLDPTSSQIGHKESTADTARVLSRVFDAIEYRGADHATVVELAQHATVPVFNGLTDKWHPTQTLADFMTMREHAPSTTTSFAYVGDARFNMGNSLLVSGATVDVPWCADHDFEARGLQASAAWLLFAGGGSYPGLLVSSARETRSPRPPAVLSL